LPENGFLKETRFLKMLQNIRLMLLNLTVYIKKSNKYFTDKQKYAANSRIRVDLGHLGDIGGKISPF